jgi:hypothetical protein
MILQEVLQSLVFRIGLIVCRQTKAHNDAKSAFAGGTMKKAILIFGVLCLASAVFAGFKVKNLKPKKPEQFQGRATMAGVTYAADLLLDGKDQKEYFYKELTPFNIIAVRLAIFNNGSDEVVLPLDGLELIAPDGKKMPLVSPESAAQAVLSNVPAVAKSKGQPRQIGIGSGSPRDPRSDPSDPRYDPRLDPNSPSYDPNDPRNTGRYPPGQTPPGTYPPGTTPGTYPTTTYPSGGTYGRPGVVINTGGGEDLSKFERALAEKDFLDKAHTAEPVPVSMSRDRFLYFSMEAPQAASKGYTLHVPVSKGIPQEIAIKF